MSDMDRVLVAGCIIGVAIWTANKAYKIGFKIGQMVTIKNLKKEQNDDVIIVM